MLQQLPVLEDSLNALYVSMATSTEQINTNTSRGSVMVTAAKLVGDKEDHNDHWTYVHKHIAGSYCYR